MSRPRGRFITVEGQDGAGKTTNLHFISKLLQQAGLSVFETREPGGTALGEIVRDIVLHRKDIDIDPVAELLLIFAARAQHVRQHIRPALERGDWVLCDRFTDATYAYQGGGRGLPYQDIAILEQLVQEELRPDLTLLLDLDVATGNDRAEQRAPKDRLEVENNSFKLAVRAAYMQLAEQDPGRIKVIAAQQSLNHVQRDIKAIMGTFIANQNPVS